MGSSIIKAVVYSFLSTASIKIIYKIEDNNIMAILNLVLVILFLIFEVLNENKSEVKRIKKDNNIKKDFEGIRLQLDKLSFLEEILENSKDKSHNVNLQSKLSEIVKINNEISIKQEKLIDCINNAPDYNEMLNFILDKQSSILEFTKVVSNNSYLLEEILKEINNKEEIIKISKSISNIEEVNTKIKESNFEMLENLSLIISKICDNEILESINENVEFINKSINMNMEDLKRGVKSIRVSNENGFDDLIEQNVKSLDDINELSKRYEKINENVLKETHNLLEKNEQIMLLLKDSYKYIIQVLDYK